MFCTKCGAEIKEGINFCPKCGASVKKGESLSPMAFPDTPPRMEPIGLMPSEQEKNGGKKGLSGKKITIVLIIVFLLLLLLAGGGAYYFIGSYQAEEEFQGAAGSGEKEIEDEADTDEGENVDESSSDGEDSSEGNEQTQEQVYQGERKPVNLSIHQVDNTNFPEVTFYASVVDENNNVIENLDKSDFTIQEVDFSGNVIDVSINEVYRVLNADTISVNLVLDASGSMSSSNKMGQAQNAANALIERMELSGGDQVEIISFDNYVYLEQDFTGQRELLTNAVNNIYPSGGTALYDALYAGLYQTYFETGVKCVIGFTDGMENNSSYTFDDVVTLAQNSGIPLFIIGIGEEYDADVLRQLAAECSGAYYSANVDNLENILTNIYLSIYEQQQDYYVFKYTSSDTANQNRFRDIVLSTSDTTEFFGTYTKEYIPQADISGAFSSDYMNMDYMLDFSSQREVTAADLDGMSLAQLRIARNEIFARHGRQFKDSMLNQWFYSRAWYLDIPVKYSPDDFDRLSPSPLSKLEIQNVEFIKSYEDMLMNTADIYPDAAYTLLSDYDLALSKAVLRNALSQIQNYADTEILRQNKQLIQQAIAKEDIQY